MPRVLIPTDPGWRCKRCKGIKLPGDPLCQSCTPEEITRGGTKRPERIKGKLAPIGAPTTHNKEGKEKMDGKSKKGHKAPEYTKHVARQVSRTVLSKTRAEGIVRDVSPWERPELVIAANEVVKSNLALIQAFDNLPDGWAPPRGKVYPKGGAALTKGDFMRIADTQREAYAKRYPGMLTAKNMDHLEVQAVAENGRVVVKTKDGISIPIYRGHLHREEAKTRTVEPAS